MRTCNHCQKVLPEGTISKKKYCDSVCQRRAANRRNRKNNMTSDRAKEYKERRKIRAALRQNMTEQEWRVKNVLERRAAITDSHLRAVRPVTSYYGRMLHQDPFLGAEYTIY